MKHFRSYQLAVRFHRECVQKPLPGYLKDQLLRASSSIALNLAEGSAKKSKKDRMRFYQIAFGSLREVQAIIDLQGSTLNGLYDMADQLGACLYRLTNA